MRLCKDSAGILLRFSLELSKYNCTIVHVPGEQNEISDVLSRHHTEIDSLIKENKEVPPMSEKQAMQLLNRLKIPNGYEFTKEEVSYMLEATSLPNPTQKKKRTSSSKLGEREVSNNPTTLHNRKIKMPKEVKNAPGALLPTCSCTTTRIDLLCNHNDTIDYSDLKIASKAVLSGMIKPEDFKKAQRLDPHCRDI